MPKVPCSISGCKKPAEKRGWCGMHYRRWHRFGTTDFVSTRPTAETRFWAKVDKNGPIHPIHGQCWVWTGCRNSDRGYGTISVKDSPVFVHRYSYAIHFESPPDDLLVCHHCDRKICVNPRHLFLGTIQDNTDDKVSKGRQLKGEQIQQSKLLEGQVLSIRKKRRSGRTLSSLASEYGVSLSLVGMICQRKIWRHI